MIGKNSLRRTITGIGLCSLAALGTAGCATTAGSMNQSQLTDFATRYAADWSHQIPTDLAAHYAENGRLVVNDGVPAVGRSAITAKVAGFMTAFPDMVVKLDSLSGDASHPTFHWTWTGTNTGPGGTGKAVRISGYEEWTLNVDGLIAESKGHYDEAEYQRQVSADSARS